MNIMIVKNLLILLSVCFNLVLGQSNFISSLDYDKSFDEFNSINFTDSLIKDLPRFLNSFTELKEIDENIVEDAFLLTNDLIKKYGYKCESHIIETSDGYLLKMHRIPKSGGQPVFLMHGLLDSSSTWVVMGPNVGFAYMLADLGYDVWMGNARGNRYSRKHKFLSIDNGNFWDFSFHEIGKYDLPAMIDYVIEKTGYKKIQYIGHSQGSLAFWILCHEHPEYNNKILSMQALGPVAYLGNCKSPVVRTMGLLLNSLTVLLKLIGSHEFMPNSEFLALFSQIFCKDDAITQILCKNIIFLITGFNDEQLNATMIPVIIGHAPAGASSRQIIHYGQLKRSGRFCQYDHGYLKNKIIYDRLTPPEYDISRIKIKVALHYSLNDWLTTPKDVEKLYQRLPNSIGKFLVEDLKFNHLDFVWAIDVRSYLYEKVVKIMKLVEKGEI